MVYLGVFFTSLSAIVLEISLTRIFSVVLWYHFAYLVVSIALFGIGAGGLIAFFLANYLEKQVTRHLASIALAQSASVVMCLLFITNANINIDFSLAGFVDLLSVYLLCTAPFLLTGLSLALAFRHFREHAHKVYFFDLVGSAIGCVIFLVAISYISGPAVVLLSAFLAAFASAFYTMARLGTVPVAKAALVGAAMLGLVVISAQTQVFAIKYTKTYEERADLLYEKWSPLARITVYPKIFWTENQDSPFGWGMSRSYTSTDPIEQLWIEQDANAGTPITRFEGDFSKLEFLKHDVTSIPYHMKPNSKVFIVGVGGGRDVLTALAFGNPTVRGCDINPVTVKLIQQRFREFSGGLYDRPEVHIDVAEARSFIRSNTERFDIIQISLIDSWAATAAGAFSLSENNLYTVEAFVDYFDSLEEDGLLSVTRFLFSPRNQSLRVAIVARQALEMMGADHPEQHIAVVGTSRTGGVATVIAKKNPFTAKEVQDLLHTAEEYDFEILYLNGQNNDVDFAHALEATDLSAFLETLYYDLRPTWDDRPFFFQMIYFTDALDMLFHPEAIHGQTFNYYAPLVLLTLLVISMIFVALFFVVPLAVSQGVQSLSPTWGTYFILLGLGFMFVEIPLLQKGSLYLGHPTYSLSVVLFSMLTFTGLGSHWSGRLSIPQLQQSLWRYLFAVGTLVACTILTLEWIIPTTIGLSLSARVGIMVFTTGMLAFLMGVAFPSGIRLFSESQRNAVPWVWALNGGGIGFGINYRDGDFDESRVPGRHRHGSCHLFIGRSDNLAIDPLFKDPGTNFYGGGQESCSFDIIDRLIINDEQPN